MPSESIDNTLGALFIGAVAACILFGTNFLQTFIYYQRYKDGYIMKALVFILWFLDFLQLILVLKTLYSYVITNFSNVFELAIAPWQITTSALVTVISNTIIRCYFARRVYILGGRWDIPVVILGFCLGGFTAGISLTAKCLANYHLYSEFSAVAVEFYIIYGTAVAADVTIASSLCYYFYNMRTGFEKADCILTTLSVYCINSGLVTCLSHLAILIAYASMPYNFVYAGIFVCSSKWYLGATLATLNARDGLRERHHVRLSTPPEKSTISRPLRDEDEYTGEENSRTDVMKAPSWLVPQFQMVGQAV